MKDTILILVRHGQSIGNATRVYLGHTNLGLTERGKMQAQLTAERLRDEKIDAIYSSDLKRAHDTAMPHAEMRGLDIIDKKELREVNVGLWEGMSIDDIIRDYHDEFLIDWKENFGTFTPPQGESMPDVGRRVYKAIEEIAKAHEGQTVLITSHAAALREFWGMILGLKFEEIAPAVPFPANASYSRIKYCDGVFTPIEFSVDDHIPGEDVPLF